ncbi:hypothetical protein T492DRAFT_625812 [Pavlovales sp. CCMP2436]|nr:hypothetical protein T492DRAFT_625812 [Pavlovales sp. CCMP2436]
MGERLSAEICEMLESIDLAHLAGPSASSPAPRARPSAAAAEAAVLLRGSLRLSFICHSQGALTLRAALQTKRFAPLLPACRTLLSLGAPHLGWLYGENALVKTLIRLLRHHPRATAIRELTLRDAANPQHSLLYRLNVDRNRLQHFDHVLLAACATDRYVPYNSASLDPSPEALADGRAKGVVYSAMLAHLLRQLREGGCEGLRIDVDFRLAGRSLDQSLGRAAHLQYLLDQHFVERLVFKYKDYFAPPAGVADV